MSPSNIEQKGPARRRVSSKTLIPANAEAIATSHECVNFDAMSASGDYSTVTPVRGRRSDPRKNTTSKHPITGQVSHQQPKIAALTAKPNPRIGSEKIPCISLGKGGLGGISSSQS
jgi:hypothetical protein